MKSSYSHGKYVTHSHIIGRNVTHSHWITIFVKHNLTIFVKHNITTFVKFSHITILLSIHLFRLFLIYTTNSFFKTFSPLPLCLCVKILSILKKKKKTVFTFFSPFLSRWFFYNLIVAFYWVKNGVNFFFKSNL